MSICLIRPPIVVPGNNMTTMSTPPLGLAYIAGALCQASFPVQVIDGLGEALDQHQPWRNNSFLVGLSLDSIVKRIVGTPEMIGVSCNFSFEWPLCRELFQLLRDRYPSALIIAGGEHVTAMPKTTLHETEIDIVVLGEGEETIVEIAHLLDEEGRNFTGVKGIAYRNAGNEIILNERRPRTRNIDDIAPPAWNTLPIEEYLDRHLGFGIDRGRSMPLMASRGCPYQCTFCSSPQMWTTRWLARDPDLVLDEIAYYQEVYKATNFDFYDLTAIVKKSWIVKFCELIEERGMKFTWQLPSGTRSEAIDSEVARLLFRSGCRNISYSPESGSMTVLTRIKKRVKLHRLLDSAEACISNGINVKFNIIFGFPGETWQEILESYRFIMQMALRGAHDVSIWAFSPYPGSELYHSLHGGDTEKPTDDYYDSLRSYADITSTRSYSEHLSNRQLRSLRTLGMILFYVSSWLSHPIRPFRVIYNLITGRHESRGDMALAQLLRFKRLQTVSRNQEI